MNILILQPAVGVADMLGEVIQHDAAWMEASRQHSAGKYFISGNRAPGTYIPLVSSDAKSLSGAADSLKVRETEFFSLYPSITTWLSAQFGKLGRVFLYKIPPRGKGIPRHIDVGAYYRAHDRYHLCLQGIYKYEVGGEVNTITAGNLFYFDNQQPHSVENIGDVDRISVVFDVPKNNTLGE